MEYLDPKRVNLHFEMPLGELIIDFYDQLKSRSSGYASLDYAYIGYRPGDLVKLDVLVSGEPVDALSLIVHRSNAYRSGKALVDKLKELIPRQMFEVPIQAAVGNKIISRANVQAMRKDVLAKCYGGDITRAYSGDYTSSFLARTTGDGFRRVFTHFGLRSTKVHTIPEGVTLAKQAMARDATPVVLTNPLWPGGRMFSARTTAAEAVALGTSRRRSESASAREVGIAADDCVSSVARASHRRTENAALHG